MGATVDTSTLVLEFNTAGLARGEREVSTIVGRIEQRLDRTVQRAQAINKAINQALNFGGGQSKGATDGLTAGLDRTAAATKRASDATLQYAQSQARLLQVQGDTVGAINTLSAATRNHEGSVKQLVSAQTQLARLHASNTWTRYASTVREAGESLQQTGYFLTGLSAGLISVGAAAVKSAFDVDKNVNVLKAFLGSTDAAEKRLKQLTVLSQKTPGLTTSLASTLDAQLRTANVSQSTIDKILPAVGRLNAVSPLGDPQKFAQNLQQLVTQGFERADLKELVGQSPLAGQVLTQLFNVDSPTNSAAIRAAATKAGLTTTDAFFAAFAEAAGKNQALAGVTENLETQFAKLVDRVTIALRPLGEAIISTLGPIVEKGASLIESLGNAFSGLPDGVKSTIVVIGALATVIGPAVVGIGAFIQAAGALGNLATVAKSLQAVTVALEATSAASTVAGTAAATAGATTAAAFAPVLPIAVAVAAVVGIAAVAWANYESATDRATKITTDQIQATVDSRNELAGLSGQLERAIQEHSDLNTVMGKLPGSSRAVADALQSEGEKAGFVAEEYKRLRQERDAQLVGQQSALTAGITESQEKIDRFRDSLRQLEQAIRDNQERQQKGLTTAVSPSSLVGEIVSIANAQGQLGAQIEETRKKEQEAIKTRDESAQKLGILQRATGQTTQSLLKYQTQAGASAEETGRLQRGIEEYEAQQRKAAGATEGTAAAMNDLGAAARQAGQDVANAFLQFDLQGIQKGIQTKTNELAQRIVKEGVSAKRAVAEAQNQVIGSLPAEGDNFAPVLTFGEASKRAKALQKAQEDVNSLLNPSPSRRGGGSGRRAESDARQLRAAEEELAKSIAKSRLDIEENTTRKLVEMERDGFEKRLVSADAYYEKLIQNELKLIDIEARRIKGEAAASATRLNAAKDGSPEAVRELAQLVELQSRLRVVESGRAETVRKLNDELLKNKTAEAERRREVIASGGSLGFEANKKFLDNFFAKQDARRDRPESELRIKETEIQALGNAGLLREQQVTDALILTRRAYREELIKSAEARKLEAQAAADLEGKFLDTSRFDEEIAGLKAIGSELTRAEALQKRFAEQGILDYSRLNEGVEDLLASQKGITEAFSDFRANLVRDQFDLIDSGVDKLTKRLGILGSAIGTLIKDLARLALSKIAQRLFGLTTGQQPSFGAQAAPAGGGFNPLSILTGGGGGIPGFSSASAGSGGGGFGQFATGGFSGGNPVQQILGGGGSSGGGSGVGGLLSKIPGIGKLFGTSGGGIGSAGTIGPNIGSLPGGIQGIQLPTLTGPGGANGAASALGGFGGLAAGGLLAGGGLLGSLAGGNSQIGKLLGGVGGTLLGGALGASGLLGGGIAGALPALFSNPFTAIIGAGLIGGALLARWIGGREQRKFRKTVESEYQIKVDGKQQGTALYKSVKELGETEFGKGKFGKMMVETIRLKKAQEMIAAYAEANGQENSALAKKFRDRVELTDPTDPRNRFTRRAYGGPVEANRPYIVGDGGRPEVFASKVPGEIFPSIQIFEKQLLVALQSSRALGGIFAGAKQGLIAQLQTRAVAQETSSGVPAEFPAVVKMMLGAIVRNTEVMDRIRTIPAKEIIQMGAPQASAAIAEAVHTSIKQSSAPGLAIKNEVFKGR